MRITNLYFNPNHEFTNDNSECPLFVRGNMEVVFEGDQISIRTVEPGRSFVTFGGHGSKKRIRLGLKAKETYTAALKVRIDKVLSGNLLPNALKISFGCYDGNGKKSETYSAPAPNEVGVWEIHHTFKVPQNVRGAWVSFCSGTQSPDDVVTISDIRITKTGGMTAPFCKKVSGVTFPYKDRADKNGCVREYDETIKLSYPQYVEYLLFAREKGYVSDIWRVKKAASGDDAFRTLTALFIDDSADSYDDLKTLFAKAGSKTRLKIAQKLVLLREYGLLDKLMPLKRPTSDSFLSKLIYVDRLVYGGDASNARKYFIKHVNADNSLSLYSHDISQEQLLLIMSSLSRNLSVLRYNTINWMARNLDEIRRRAESLSDPQFVPESRRPVWVFWAQGIDNAPEVVKRCISRMKNVFGDRLVILNDKNLRYYINSHYSERMSTFASRSDYIRAELLYRYGGTWVDSTVLVTEEFRRIVDNKSFVSMTYDYPRPIVGSWVISVSEKRTWFFSLLFAALMMWISEHGNFNEYYMFHIFWRILTEMDERSKEAWRNVYPIDAPTAIVFDSAQKLLEVLGDNEFEERINSSPVLKLTYKYKENEVRLNSNIARLMRGEM